MKPREQGTYNINRIMNIKGKLYRFIMKLAHKYNWHYAPPIYPDNDMQLWCKWCGFRETYKNVRKIRKDFISNS